MNLSNQNMGEIVLYQPEDSIRLEVRVEATKNQHQQSCGQIVGAEDKKGLTIFRKPLIFKWR